MSPIRTISIKSHEEIDKHRKMFDDLAEDLHLKYCEDWYDISISNLTSNSKHQKNIVKLIRYEYKKRISNAIVTIYEDTDWQCWKFPHAPHGYWTCMKNQRKFLHWLANQLNIERDDDWYRITREEVQKLGGIGLLAKYRNSLWYLWNNANLNIDFY
jgi:hypothetical protein